MNALNLQWTQPTDSSAPDWISEGNIAHLLQKSLQTVFSMLGALRTCDAQKPDDAYVKLCALPNVRGLLELRGAIKNVLAY